MPQRRSGKPRARLTSVDHGLMPCNQSPGAAIDTVPAIMDMPKSRRPRPVSADHDGYGDPAIEALTQLLESERSLARAEEPTLVARCDPGQVWLLWFAIGATDEICRFAHRQAEFERNQVFRHVVGMIFGNGVQSEASPVAAAQDLIELFESAGVEAVRACMRGDRKLGYYLEALKVSSRHSA
jgi:hypothetical protein